MQKCMLCFVGVVRVWNREFWAMFCPRVLGLRAMRIGSTAVNSAAFILASTLCGLLAHTVYSLFFSTYFATSIFLLVFIVSLLPSFASISGPPTPFFVIAKKKRTLLLRFFSLPATLTCYTFSHTHKPPKPLVQDYKDLTVKSATTSHY